MNKIKTLDWWGQWPNELPSVIHSTIKSVKPFSKLKFSAVVTVPKFRTSCCCCCCSSAPAGGSRAKAAADSRPCVLIQDVCALKDASDGVKVQGDWQVGQHKRFDVCLESAASLAAVLKSLVSAPRGLLTPQRGLGALVVFSCTVCQRHHYRCFTKLDVNVAIVCYVLSKLSAQCYCSKYNLLGNRAVVSSWVKNRTDGRSLSDVLRAPSFTKTRT